MGLALTLVFLAIFVVSVAVQFKASDRFARALAEQRAQIRFWPTSSPGRLGASEGGLSFDLFAVPPGVEVVVGGVPRGVELRHVSAALRPGRVGLRPLLPEVEGPIGLGDPDFEFSFSAGGQALSALALFGATQRRLLMDLASEGFIVQGMRDGELFALLRCDHRNPAAVARRLSAALARLSCLEPRDELPALLEHIRVDPAPGFRERCLVELLTQADQSARSAAISIAKASGHPPMELAAAVAAADASGARIALRRGGADSALISGSLAALASASASADERRALGLELLSATSPAVEAAGAHLIAEAAAPGDAEIEAALLAACEGADPLSLPAIADALGRVGTVASVPALHDLERASREAFTRGRLEWARRTIQTRARGAEAGALSLGGQEPQAGALTVSLEAGGVALAERSPGAREGRG